MKPFRFGIETSQLPSKTWQNDLKFIEETGYSSILWTDHFGKQWDPTTAMATTAAHTTKLKTGTMVYCARGVLVGGGGKMVLGLAGRHADIVNVMSGLPEGEFTSEYFRRGVLEGHLKRIGYVRDAALKAGRDFEDIELSLALSHVEVTDDCESVIEFQAERRGLSVDDVKRNPGFLIGSVAEVKDRLFDLREVLGVNYFVLGIPSVEEIRQFGEYIVKDMTGK